MELTFSISILIHFIINLAKFKGVIIIENNL